MDLVYYTPENTLISPICYAKLGGLDIAPHSGWLSQAWWYNIWCGMEAWVKRLH